MVTGIIFCWHCKEIITQAHFSPSSFCSNISRIILHLAMPKNICELSEALASTSQVNHSRDLVQTFWVKRCECEALNNWGDTKVSWYCWELWKALSIGPLSSFWSSVRDLLPKDWCRIFATYVNFTEILLSKRRLAHFENISWTWSEVTSPFYSPSVNSQGRLLWNSP